MANSIIGNNSPNPGVDPNMLNQIKQFAQTFKGDPKTQVMQMVRQGMRSNEQLQQAMNMARQLQGMFK